MGKEALRQPRRHVARQHDAALSILACGHASHCGLSLFAARRLKWYDGAVVENQVWPLGRRSGSRFAGKNPPPATPAAVMPAAPTLAPMSAHSQHSTTQPHVPAAV